MFFVAHCHGSIVVTGGVYTAMDVVGMVAGLAVDALADVIVTDPVS
jgi:hypothetical protein